MGRAEELRDELVEGGVAAVEALRGQSESLHLECKRDLRVSQESLAHLSKTASAFLNTEGGVLVWGANAPSARSDRPELIDGFTPLDDVPALVSWLRSRTSGVVVPAPVGIEHLPVVPPRKKSGYVVSYVPMSATPPHRAMYGQQHYFLRSPSSSFEMPHGVLAAMFGRRPTPSMRVLVALAKLEPASGSVTILTLAVSMRNAGVALASAPYLALRAETPRGGQSGIAIQANQDSMQWMVIQRHIERRTSEFDQSFSSSENLTVGPGGAMAGAEVLVWLNFRERHPLIVSGIVGAKDCPPTPWRMKIDRDQLDAAAARAGGGSYAGEDVERRLQSVFTSDTLEGGDYRHVLIEDLHSRT